jgi:hypothetical protein
MHNQDPRAKTALAPSTVRTGDGAAANCCPPRKRPKRRRPSSPVDTLTAATQTPSMILECRIVHVRPHAQNGRIILGLFASFDCLTSGLDANRIVQGKRNELPIHSGTPCWLGAPNTMECGYYLREFVANCPCRLSPRCTPTPCGLHRPNRRQSTPQSVLRRSYGQWATLSRMGFRIAASRCSRSSGVSFKTSSITCFVNWSS